MTHIYLNKCTVAERKVARSTAVAEINLLRKFEGFTLIEERIDKRVDDLHSLWFRKDKTYLG